MKKISKFLSIILTLIMVISIIPMSNITASAATSGKCGDNLTWTFDESTGTLTISGTGAMYDYGGPYWTLEGYNDDRPWTWFWVKEVVIGNGITSIGSSAFEHTGIEKATIPNSVTSIGRYAFSYCNLANITIPNSVTRIGSMAFAYCENLESIVVPNSVKDVGGGVFYGCSSLKSAIISNRINKLDSSRDYNDRYDDVGFTTGFFGNCANLENLTISNSISTIADETFANCSSLTNVYFNGTQKHWEEINIGREENGALFYAKIHFLEPAHIFGEWSTVTKASCQRNGVKKRVCLDCGEDFVGDIPKIEHGYEDFGYPPTCTDYGYEELRCKDCGDSPYEDMYSIPISPLGHDYGDFTIDVMPTCTTVGSKSQHCSRCDSKTNITVIPTISHTLTWHTLSAATCQTDGVSHGYCEDCSYFEVQTTPKTDHGDTNGDGKCDGCDMVLCNHDCHKGGITGFFWKISNFFNKLFRSNKYCECGVAHY